VAFIYIWLRVRRIRWILWGTVYFAIIMVFAILPFESKYAETSVGLMVVAGFISIVHAFLVRDDYLVRLENRMHKAAEEEAGTRSRLEEEYRSRRGEPPSRQSPEELEYTESSGTDSDARRPNISESAAESSQTAVPALAPVEINVGSGSEAEGSSQKRSISETYPLPIAYGWSLLAGLWDPRDRYREQLRHAENMLAFPNGTYEATSNWVVRSECLPQALGAREGGH
jgi:hypothetical protein